MSDGREDLEFRNGDLYQLEFGEADIQRLARALTLSAHYVLERGGEEAADAAVQALDIRAEVLSQTRGQKWGDA